ncbi:MAG: TonB-dependent receptor [Pseudomonadota bacterium]
MPLLLAQEPAEPVPSCIDGACTFRYETAFFARYAPVTALDLVSNLPGFTLIDGEDLRGFGAASGNLLINGERITAKSEAPSAILARIPLADVRYVEVIRGQLGGLDLQGQTVVANVVRSGTAASGAWSVGAITFRPDTRVHPFGTASYSGEYNATRYTLSLEAESYQNVQSARERVFLPSGMRSDDRREVFDEHGDAYALALTAARPIGATRLSVNAAVRHFDESGGERSRRRPVDALPFEVFQADTDKELSYEFGFDAERALSETLSGKLIGLYRQSDYTETGALVRLVPGGTPVVDSDFRFDSLNTERIVRLELDYTALEGHLLEAALEVAANDLESDFALRAAIDGTLTSQFVPGARSRVRERRVDLRLADAFEWGPIAIELALGAERSKIEQSGGFARSRSFSFFKPSIALNYAPNASTQLRLRALRDVGQLDFFDFVSSTDLGDVELALGNPDLAPERTRTIDARVEQRFGALGVFALTLYHDRIVEVIDQLPLDGVLEVPGNIGDAQRWGVDTTLTAPLGWTGLRGARMDFTGSWQGSAVDDPLTGRSRPLSGEPDWQYVLAVRQDLPARRLAWGVTLFSVDRAPLFGLDELEGRGRRWDVDVFAERRWASGLRLRVGVDNALRNDEVRDRQVFSGRRDRAAPAFRERRRRRPAREFYLELTGTL